MSASNKMRRLGGVLAALPTPFHGERLDLDAFDRHCEQLIARGVAGLVPCGTTGEAATLTDSEHAVLVASAVRAAAGRVPVIAGIGAGATPHAIARARSAEAVGADGVLASPPAHIRPTQAGLLGHFEALHGASGLPIVLYDVASRTGVALALDTIVRLADLPRVIGLKDASGDLTRPIRLRARIGADFVQLSGDDATAVAHLALGGHGSISVTANVAPALSVALFDAWRRGDQAKVAQYRDLLDPLNAALFAETNPTPLKAAMAQQGKMAPVLRLPLLPATPATEADIAAALDAVMPAEKALAMPFRQAA